MGTAAILSRPDFENLRPSALGKFLANMDTVENNFLAGGAWIGGQKISLADVHVAWVIRWVLKSLAIEKEPGFGRDAFPKIYKWFDER